jgi:hypothetical protein
MSETAGLDLDALERDMVDGEWKSLIKAGFELITELRASHKVVEAAREMRLAFEDWQDAAVPTEQELVRLNESFGAIDALLPRMEGLR